MASAKFEEKCVAAVNPMLEPGEQIQMVEVAGLAEPKELAKRRATAAAVGIAASVISGSRIVATAKPRSFILAITDRRVYFVEVSGVSVAKEVAFSVDRSAITTQPLTKRLLTYAMGIDFPGAESLQLVWGRAQGKLAHRFVGVFDTAAV
ncbi:MAG: hypothetical protein ACJ786_31420 [Catenulispora sp.]